MNERVLITGASGFIGYYLVKEALAAGLEVHAAVRPTSDISRLRELNPVMVALDFSSVESLRQVLDQGQYSYIIHAAGATRAKNEEDYNRINAIYTKNLAEAAATAARPIKRFVFLSSLAAIGPLPFTEQQPITENTTPKPVTGYGKSKLLAERYLSAFKTLNITIIRPTAVYGPGEKDIFIVFKTLNRGLDPYIGSDPQRFSFVYVNDLVESILSAMLKGPSGHAAFNISDGFAYDRYALADEFRKISNKNPLRIHIPFLLISWLAGGLDIFYKYSKKTPVLNREKLNELSAPNWNCSIEAAARDLNYKPKYSLNQGLTQTLSWYREQGWL
jgi:nucleoside-diphosphate-sugar epimerase